MNEERFRVALESLDETIRGYGEDTIFAALGVIAERFGWDLTRRDPGPCCCDYGDFYERQNLMTPQHECPAPAPIEEPDPLGDYVEEQTARIFTLTVPKGTSTNSWPRRWS